MPAGIGGSDKAAKRIPYVFLPFPKAVYLDYLRELTGAELKVYLVVIWHTYAQRDPKTGKRKTSASISIDEFKDATGNLLRRYFCNQLVTNGTASHHEWRRMPVVRLLGYILPCLPLRG